MRSVLILAVLLTVSLFSAATALCAEYSVAPNGNDSGPGSSTQPWKTLQHAADSVSAGDTVVVQSGTYAGFKSQSSGTPGNPITFKAASGANAVVNSLGPDEWHGSIIEIENNDYWVIEGFEVTGAPSAAGIDIRVAEHVTVRNCHVHHNQKWGIFTGFVEYFTAENNECSYSAEEHGIYHSNSGDNAVIRYNYCHHNDACGIQINADPSMGGDGISSDCVVTHNILTDNGAAGGAAINLASVRDSLIANNLMYNNTAGGIAGWDDGQGYEWGCKNNRFYNNTIHMPSNGRWALNLGNGSTSCRVYNNILYHEASYRGGIEIDSSSLSGLQSGNNIFDRASVDEETISLAQWQSQYGYDGSSFSAEPSALFTSPGSDYSLKSGSPAIDAGRTLAEVSDDINGNARPAGSAYDIGAYESGSGGGTTPSGSITGWYYDPSRSAVGVSVEKQGTSEKVYTAVYMYDASGAPVWYSALMDKTGERMFSGELKRYTGFPLAAPPDTSSGIQSVSQGTATLAFTPAGEGTLSISPGGTPTQLTLQKYMDSLDAGALDSRDIHGWWYDPDYEGMGWFIEAKGNTLFAAWYHYDASRGPRWWIMGGYKDIGGFTDADAYYGTFIEVTQQSGMQETQQGEGVLRFRKDGKATLTWSATVFDLERYSFENQNF